MPQAIILDTNVVSEMMRIEPDPKVILWHMGQDARNLFTTSITVAEVLFGLAMMPQGRRRDDLAHIAEVLFGAMHGRILSFDQQASGYYALVRGEKRRRGLQMGALDAQIAAIARRENAALATRNTADFEHCGVVLINPWLS